MGLNFLGCSSNPAKSASNPSNFEILYTKEIGDNLVAGIRYPAAPIMRALKFFYLKITQVSNYILGAQ